MKTLFTSCILFFATLLMPVWAQSSLNGSWKMTSVDGQPITDEVVAICEDGYFMFGQYQSDGSFVSAGGGNYKLEDNEYQLIYDFHSQQPQLVRIPQTFQAELTDEKFTLQNSSSGKMVWERMQEETTPLTGTWLFATRVDEDGNEGERRQPGPRMTVKILSGNRFQWAAFNYETKEFRGTGGGTYEAEDGTYTEHIEFFSRDNERVGASLSFQFEREGDDWDHQGQSSAGEPMHEVWTKMDQPMVMDNEQDTGDN